MPNNIGTNPSPDLNPLPQEKAPLKKSSLSDLAAKSIPSIKSEKELTQKITPSAETPIAQKTGALFEATLNPSSSLSSLVPSATKAEKEGIALIESIRQKNLEKETKLVKKQEAKEAFKNNAALYGNKSANLLLLDMLCEDLEAKVPPFLPLSHTDILNHLTQNAPEWNALWEEFCKAQGSEEQDLTADAKKALEKLRSLITETFEKAPFQPANLQAFSESLEKEALLMVRSTGKEDSDDLANPGGNESLAGVSLDSTSLSQAISEVVASYFSEKSMKQRLIGKDNLQEPPFMPVLIQKMIGEKRGGNASSIPVSMVMYTSLADVKIQAALGQGTGIVEGLVPFDTFTISREGLVHPQMQEKETRLIPVEGNKLALQKNSPSESKTLAISMEEAYKIASLGREIQEFYEKPMDMELVFDPSTQTTYLVQARPIPGENNHFITPSTLSAKGLLKVKESGVPLFKGNVIASAGCALKTLTNSSEMVVATTIEEGFQKYLAAPKGTIKAVFLKEEAPSESHQAAQMNADSVIVMQLPQFDSFKGSFTTPSFLVVDPQRQLVFEASSFKEEAKEALFTKGILTSPSSKNIGKVIEGSTTEDEEGKTTFHTLIKRIYSYMVMQLPQFDSFKGFFTPRSSLKEDLFTEGMLKSPWIARETTLPSYWNIPHTKDTLEENQVAPSFSAKNIGELIQGSKTKDEEGKASFHTLMKRIYSYLPKDTLKKHSLGEIRNFLDTLEAGGENALPALEQILGTFYLYAKEASPEEGRMRPLFRQVALVGAEIATSLKKLKEESSSQNQDSLRESCNRLSGLIFYGGDTRVFSDSLFQYLQTLKEKDKIKAPLTTEQKNYFIECRKVSSLAVESKTQEKWNDFSLSLVQSPQAQSFFTLLKELQKANLTSAFLNRVFVKLNEEGKDVAAILHGMQAELDATLKALEPFHLNEKRAILNNWEGKISEWSHPSQFDSLWQDFSKSFLPLLQTDIPWNTPPLVKETVLKFLYDSLEVMDKTIKSQKGSPEYADNKELQVTRFATMLEPLLAFMQKALDNIPEAQVATWRLQIIEENASKKTMLEAISTLYSELKEKKDPHLLQASESFSVAAAAINSGTSFGREFEDKKTEFTLEDLFTLMHTNAKVGIREGLSNALAEQGLSLDKQIPKELLSFNDELIISNPAILNNNYLNFELQYVETSFPVTTMRYNLALRCHSVSLDLIFNHQTKQTEMQFFFLGHNFENRMTKIASHAAITAKALDIQIFPDPPLYNKEKNEVLFRFKLSEAQIEDKPLLKCLLSRIGEECQSTFVDSGSQLNLNRFSFNKEEWRSHERNQISLLNGSIVKGDIEEFKKLWREDERRVTTSFIRQINSLPRELSNALPVLSFALEKGQNEIVFFLIKSLRFDDSNSLLVAFSYLVKKGDPKLFQEAFIRFQDKEIGYKPFKELMFDFMDDALSWKKYSLALSLIENKNISLSLYVIYLLYNIHIHMSAIDIDRIDSFLNILPQLMESSLLEKVDQEEVRNKFTALKKEYDELMSLPPLEDPPYPLDYNTEGAAFEHIRRKKKTQEFFKENQKVLEKFFFAIDAFLKKINSIETG